MAVELKEQNGGKVVTVRVTGKLSKEDYSKFVPEVERLIEEFGKIRVLFEMLDFHGWEADPGNRITQSVAVMSKSAGINDNSMCLFSGIMQKIDYITLMI